MASKSTTEKMKRIQKTVNKYAAKRKALKEAGDYAGLARLPAMPARPGCVDSAP